jgi:ketosteroid isomerase-like protein
MAATPPLELVPSRFLRQRKAMGEATEVVERFYERFGAGDLAGAFECFAPECVAVGLSGPLNNDAHHAAARNLKDAMPDCHMESVRTLESGEEIYVTGRFKGTHRNDLATPLGTIVATGKTLDLLFVDYFRVRNGKIVECEVVRDRLGMMIQLGAIPPE